MSDEKYTTVDLDWFVGREFALTAAEEGSASRKTYGDEFENASAISFTLNGVTYQAVEDPNDGYRSSLDEIRVLKESLSNTFPPCVAMAKKSDREDDYRVDNIVQFIDTTTGKVVLEVGTANTDDYYPSFIGRFMPEGMAINADTSKSVAQRLDEASMNNPGWASW